MTDIVKAGGNTAARRPRRPAGPLRRVAGLLASVALTLLGLLLVTFLIGCSFTFETGLQEAGIEVRHIADGCNVPMYRSNRACRPAGRLHGEMVVSMRPIPADRVAEAAGISGRYPSVHGAPVHIGEPDRLGIKDLHKPDFGDAVRIEPGEVPVFWACGVTPQAAVMASGVPFAITHSPGHMFITDVPDSTYHV